MASKFDKIESIENWVAWGYLRGELKWSASQIAYELWLNEDRLIEWVNERRAEMERLANKQKGKVEEIQAELKAKYGKTEDTDERKLELNVRKVVKLFLDKEESLADTAKTLKVDYHDFRAWWQRKLGVINQELRKLKK